jgi:hypothetical protein
VLSAALSGLLLFSGAAKATPVVNIGGGIGAFVAIGGTFGWVFNTSSPIVAAELGIFDVGGDGLSADHAIGLWLGNGTLLRAAIISNANSTVVAPSFFFGNWRAVPIPPLILPAVDYVLGATYASGDPDFLLENVTPFSAIPGITFGGAKVSTGSGLLLPIIDQPGVNAGYFGPNAFTPHFGTSAFTSDVLIAIPEPSSLLLLGFIVIGFIGCIIWERKDRLI